MNEIKNIYNLINFYYTFNYIFIKSYSVTFGNKYIKKMISSQNKIKKKFHSLMTLLHVFLQKKKRASQKSEWSMENQRK